jgi:short-subunit dehydrogenase
MSTSLSEQVVLITGASAGIGAALATRLAQSFMGIRLVLAARRSDRLEQVADRCRKAGAEVLVIPTDLTEPDQVQNLVEKTLADFSRIDILVNNAGYGRMGPLELMPLEACKHQYEVNLFGPLVLTQAVIPAMRNQGGGRIIAISSIGGRIPFPLGGLYSSSKFALETMCDVLRMELEAFNIAVSIVEPGPVTTEFFNVAASEVEQTIAQPLETPYRAAFAQLDRLEEITKSRAWTAEQVAEVIIRAMTDRRPRPRYVAASGGDMLLFLMRKVLPTWAVDKFWQRFYGLDRVAQDWKRQPLP